MHMGYTLDDTEHRREICTSLNHHKKIKAEPSWLIPRKLTTSLELVNTAETSHEFFSKYNLHIFSTILCFFTILYGTKPYGL